MNRKPLVAGIGGGALVLLATLFGARRGRQFKQLGSDFIVWLGTTRDSVNAGTECGTKPDVLEVLTKYGNELDHIGSLADFRNVITDKDDRQTLVDAYAAQGHNVTDAANAYLVYGRRAAVKAKAGRRSNKPVTRQLPDDSSANGGTDHVES